MPNYFPPSLLHSIHVTVTGRDCIKIEHSLSDVGLPKLVNGVSWLAFEYVDIG